MKSYAEHVKTTMGRDQYGQFYHNLGIHPRKELLKRLGYKHAQKMYVDVGDHKSVHVGYVIGGHWITLYNVSAYGKETV